MEELELRQEPAIRLLHDNDGDVEKAFSSFVNAPPGTPIKTTPRPRKRLNLERAAVQVVEHKKISEEVKELTEPLLPALQAFKLAHPRNNNNIDSPPMRPFPGFARSMLDPPHTTLPPPNYRYTVVSETPAAGGSHMKDKHRSVTLRDAHGFLAEYRGGSPAKYLGQTREDRVKITRVILKDRKELGFDVLAPNRLVERVWIVRDGVKMERKGPSDADRR
jgi:hypothetical protein